MAFSVFLNILCILYQSFLIQQYAIDKYTCVDVLKRPHDGFLRLSTVEVIEDGFMSGVCFYLC